MAAEWHHFKRIAHGFIPWLAIFIDGVPLRLNHPLDVDFVCFWHHLVEEKIQSAQALFFALPAPPVDFALPTFALPSPSPLWNAINDRRVAILQWSEWVGDRYLMFRRSNSLVHSHLDHGFRDRSHSKYSIPLTQSLACFSESNCLTISVRLNFSS